MRAELIYKCQRCGDLVANGNISSSDEFGAADMTILHECSVIREDARMSDNDSDNIIVSKIGLAKLVGYDEYPV